MGKTYVHSRAVIVSHKIIKPKIVLICGNFDGGWGCFFLAVVVFQQADGPEMRCAGDSPGFYHFCAFGADFAKCVFCLLLIDRADGVND